MFLEVTHLKYPANVHISKGAYRLHRLRKITGMFIDVQTFFSMSTANLIIEKHYQKTLHYL